MSSDDHDDESVDAALAALTNDDNLALRRLWINGNKLTRIPPAVFSHLPWLTQLSLNCNAIASIPPEIAQLKRLKKLYFESTTLTTLPRELNTMTRLDALFVNDNDLCTIPPLTNLTLLSCLWLRCVGLPLFHFHARTHNTMVLLTRAAVIVICPPLSHWILVTAFTTLRRNEGGQPKFNRK